jgi:uncharacterized membrane protein YfcA
LLPAFLAFLPPEVAVAMTAIVHFLNNIFKLLLVGRHAQWGIVIRFGLPAIIAAFAGAALLILVNDLPPLAVYAMAGNVYRVTPVKVVMAILIAVFALLELAPWTERLEVDKKYLPLGGLLSGFFGGLSGHQGALRSAFLIRAGLSKEAFIATGVVTACLVDVTRLAVYASHLSVAGLEHNALLLIAATSSAFLGAFLGNRLVRKVTLRSVRVVVAILLFVIAAGLASGMV